MKKLLVILILLTNWALSQENLLKTVALNYKTRQVSNAGNYDYNFHDLRSNYGRTIIAGLEWDGIQPVGIFRNMSDTTLTFKVRCQIYNNDLKKLIYNISVNVSDECLRMKDTDSIYCGGNPFLKVRYCSVTEKDGYFSNEYLPYPGGNNLKGIPPGGYAEVHFSTFEPTDFFPYHTGNCTISIFIIPIVPETDDTLKEKDFTDDTLKFNLLIRKKECAELYYPPNGDTVKSEDNIFYSLSNASSTINKSIEFSKSPDFANIEQSSTKLILYNLKFDKGSKYYWRLNIQKADSNCISETRSFFVENGTSVSETNELISLSPNPASDYLTLNIPPLEKRGLGGVLTEISIFDIFGKPVLNVGAIHELPLRIDISSLPAGVYFVRIRNKVEKFVKL